MKNDINITIPVVFAGMFRITAKAPDGSERVLADWFPNLITDNGLDLLGGSPGNPWGSSVAASCFVGSGSTPPTAADSSLESQVASTSNIEVTTPGLDATNRYVSLYQEYQFGIGAAAGNLSEIAVGLAPSNLFSRSLIKDSGGNPTAITVLSNEILTVSYELRCRQPTVDTALTVSGFDVVLRSANADTLFTRDGWYPMCPGLSHNDTFGFMNYVSNDAIDTIDNAPGTDSTNKANSVANDAYVPGSYIRTGTVFFGTGVGNITINSFAFQFFPGQFQCSIDLPLLKNNTDELTIGVSLTWARDGELPS